MTRSRNSRRGTRQGRMKVSGICPCCGPDKRSPQDTARVKRREEDRRQEEVIPIVDLSGTRVDWGRVGEGGQS